MKKLFGLMLLCTTMILSFSSCSKEESFSTYTFVFNAQTFYSETSVIIFEYNNSGDKINSNSIKCKKGYTQTFTANEEVEKVKVYIDGKWVQRVFSLKKGSNTTIEITGDTLIGKEEP